MMKVLSFIRQRSFARYIMIDLSAAARSLGWSVQWLDLEGVLYAKANEPQDGKLRVVAETVTDIERFDPDLVFSYGLEYLEPVFKSFVNGFDTSFRDVLKRPAVFFLCDFGFPFDSDKAEVLERYMAPLQGWNSLVMSWDREATAVLRQLGISRARYCPLAVNERMFHAGRDAGPSIPVLFVGGPTDDRRRLLEPLADLGLTIHGYDSHGWKQSRALRDCYAGEILERDRLRAVYQRACISVNVTRSHGPSSLNMRVFEAMACGSLVLTDDCSDARTLFKEGEEIIIYRDATDLKAKVAYYLKHPEIRRAIAQAGMRRVLSAHTYVDRLRSIESTVDQFHRECRAFARLAEFTRSDPAKALRFSRYLELENVIKLDTENLRLLQARAYLAGGDVEQAGSCAAEVLDINPRNVDAKAFARRLHQAA